MKELKLLDILEEVLKLPYGVLEREVHHEWSFGPNQYPSEIESNEEPPIRLKNRPDVIEIDGVLGLYDYKTQTITLFVKGIAEVAELLALRPYDLRYVVRLHEWAHALLHLGITAAIRRMVIEDESIWTGYLPSLDSWFRDLEKPLHERLAQLLTHYSLQSLRAEARTAEGQVVLDRIAQAFQTLTRRAPPEYHIDQLSILPKERILESIRLLKARTLIGLHAWETVVAW